MSRFLAASALVFSLLSSVASADVAYVPHQGGFAKAPEAEVMIPPEMPARALDRDSVRQALLARRATNLATFRAYQKRAVFPSNTYQNQIINVWRDDAGNLCAVATLVNQTDKKLVERVAEQTNYIKLGTVTTGPLMDWMLTSGFTQEEIAQIQLPDSPVTTRPIPAPHEAPVQVLAKLRAAETARLVKQFKQVDAKLVKDQKANIELAVTRLMKHPELAWALIDNA
jgi:hypothetical protein